MMSWRFRQLVVLLALAPACASRGPDAPQPLTPTPHTATSAGTTHGPAQTPAATDGARSAGGAVAAAEPTYRLAWLVPSPEWTKAVSIAPWGDVVSYGSRTLRVHARDSGKVLAETSTCFTFPDAFGFVGDRLGAMVCEDSINLFTFPDASYRGVRKLPGRARAAGFGARLLAVADAHGRVRLFETRQWRQKATIEGTEPVSALAFAPDDSSLAIGLADGRIRIHSLESKPEVTIEARRGAAVTALAFAPDGRSLFGSAGPKVALWSTTDGTEQHAFPLVRDLVAARWLSEDDVVVTGPDGLLVVRVHDGAARSIGDGSEAGSSIPLTLDTSLDGSMLCVGAPAGSVRCYARRNSSMTSAPARPEPVPEPVPGRCVPAGAELSTMGGRIVSHQAERLQVRVGSGAAPPAIGECAQLEWHEHRKEGEVDASRWRELGEVRVEEVRADVVHLRRVEGPDEPMSGADDAPLPYDTPVRLRWAAR